MTPDQFERVRDLYGRALECPAPRRAAFLDEVCSDDPALRREVESLLAEQQRMGSFLEEPAVKTAARNLISAHRESCIGKRVGNFEIVAFLDAGGMSEVYRSRDTKLKRDVAIKVLPAELSQDADRILRFKREAELLATLNHPNIAQIYGFEESGDMLCLVLELVEGETLRERIARGPLPQDEALEIASQIAQALEAAHDREIIHRDLKPANVKFTPDGKVKVLDFGLAKAISPQPDAISSGPQSPTVVGSSLPGVILGTAGYMSPEQAKGRVVDTRTDVWAFGCVLYEMLTGKTAFSGDSVIEVLGAILQTEPDWTALPQSTPPSIRSLLKRCLQRDRARRLRHIADARFQIEEAQQSAPLSSDQAAPAAKSRQWNGWVAWALVLILGAIAFARRNPISETTLPEMRLQILTPSEGNLTTFAISPDGRKLIYSAQNRYWMRSLDSETADPLPGTENSGVMFWTPDGKAIGFSTSDQLKHFVIGGDSPRMLSPLPAGVGAKGGSWNSEGSLLVGSPGDGMPLYLLPLGSTTPVPVTTFEQGQTAQAYPYFLPDGRRFLFFSRTVDGQGIYIGSLDSKETHKLFDSDTAAVFKPPDYVLFARHGSLLAQRVDLVKFSPIGEPITLSPEISVDASVGSSSVRAALGASASAAGPVAWRTRYEQTQLAWVDRSGRMIGFVNGTENSNIRQPDDFNLSPDGHTAAIGKTINGNKDIWLIDIDRGVPRRFTFNSGWDGHAIWSPDGKQIVFSALRKGVLDLYVRATSEKDPEMPLIESPQGKVPQDWSPDGRFLLYQQSSAQTSDDLFVLYLREDVRKPTPIPVVQTAALECCGRFSPDGQAIAYQSWETGRSEIYIQPFMGRSGKQRISTDGGVAARWRRDGKELYYRTTDGRLMAVPIESVGGTIKAGTAVSLFRIATPVYAPSIDGQKFLVNVVTEPASPITILLNWKP